MSRSLFLGEVPGVYEAENFKRLDNSGVDNDLMAKTLNTEIKGRGDNVVGFRKEFNLKPNVSEVISGFPYNLVSYSIFDLKTREQITDGFLVKSIDGQLVIESNLPVNLVVFYMVDKS